MHVVFLQKIAIPTTLSITSLSFYFIFIFFIFSISFWTHSLTGYFLQKKEIVLQQGKSYIYEFFIFF